MKTLILMRHAKSSWKNMRLSDIERPLNGRGKRTAPRMGRLLNNLPINPQIVLCSTANRATQSASLVLEQLTEKPVLQLEKNIYAATSEELINLLTQTDDRVNCVLLIGHNPELEELTARLDTDFCDRLATAAMLIIECNIESWRSLGEDCGEIKALYTPRELFPDI